MRYQHTPGPCVVANSIKGAPQIVTGDNVLDPILVATVNGSLLQNTAGNARLLAMAYTSYDRHCGPRAIECAEDDLLGELVEVLRGLYDAEQASVPFAPTPRIQAALSQAWTVLAKAKGDTDAEQT